MREKMRRRQRERSHQWAGCLSASKCSVNIALSSKQHYSSLSAHYIMARSPTVCRFVSLYYISSLFCYVSSLFLSSPTLYFSTKSLLFSPSFNTFVFYTRLFQIFSPFVEVCSPSLIFWFLHIFPFILVIQPPPLLCYFPLSHLLSLEYLISLYLSAFPLLPLLLLFPSSPF